VLVAHKRRCSAAQMAVCLSPATAPLPLELVEEPGSLLVPAMAGGEVPRVMGWFEAWLAGREG
jgi:hypothetical protein